MSDYGKGKHDSKLGLFGGRVQKYTDPLSWIFGDKYTNFISHDLPREVNHGLSTVMKPFEKVDKKINPVRKISGVDKGMDEVAEHPGDALAAVAGAIFGGGALLGGAGGGAAGGAGSVGSAGSAPASAAGGSSVSNWVSMAQQFGAGQQQPQKQELDQEDPDLRYDPNAYLQYSSKTVKTRVDDAPNVDLTNPIDRNGAEILAIQELSKEIEAVSKRVAQLKRAKTRIAT